jgi:hypothetical protein
MKKAVPVRKSKCRICGREQVPLSKKGFLTPHVTLDGKRHCWFSGLGTGGQAKL